MKKIGLLAMMALLCFSACKESEAGGDVILFTGTESQPRVTFTIENPQDMGITVSATDRVERDTKVTLALGTQADLDAYNAQDSVIVEKKTKSGKKELDLKQYIPAVTYTVSEDQASFTVRLPAGDGLNLNPALLVGHLQAQYGLPAWQCHILRTRIYVEDGIEFR